MEKWLDKIFKDAHHVSFVAFFTPLFIFEFFDVTLITPEKFFDILNLILPLLGVILSFFAIITFERLSALQNDELSSDEIRTQLKKVGKRTLLFIFIFLVVSIISVTDRNHFLQSKFTIQLDRVLISVIIAFSAYIFLSAGRSYLNNLKPTNNR
jgi:hypothetical protein